MLRVLKSTLPAGIVRGMDRLLAYLKTLSPDEQADYAIRCGTTIGYLRKAISINQRIGAEICIQLEIESRRAVRGEDVRPDIDWARFRSADPAPAPLDAPQPAEQGVANV